MIVDGIHLSMVKGDTESMTVSVDGYPFSTGDIIEFTVRKRPTAEDKILYKKVTVFDSSGKANIRIDPADTSEHKAGDYTYDVQLTYADGTVKTIIKCDDGTRQAVFTLLPEVTYA